MNTSLCRTSLALAGALVWLTAAQANDLRFSDMEDRLGRIEAQLAAQHGIQSASYMDDMVSDDATSNGCACESGCCDSCGCGDACGGGCCGCGDACGGCGNCCNDCCDPCCGSYYAEVQMVFARLHAPENSFGGNNGKLSEQYELAPRFIVGYENGCGQGARARYWHYGYATPILNDDDLIRFELDVLDLEATQRFCGRRSDVVLSGGFRAASLDITDDDNDVASNDLIGLTMAADVRTLICCECDREWNFVYGGRVSLLGGDWDAHRDHDFINDERDDNIIVQELYAGVEYGCCYCGYDLYTRLAWEMQVWDSAVIDSSGDMDLFGFVGPAWHVGVGF